MLFFRKELPSYTIDSTSQFPSTLAHWHEDSDFPKGRACHKCTYCHNICHNCHISGSGEPVNLCGFSTIHRIGMFKSTTARATTERLLYLPVVISRCCYSLTVCRYIQLVNYGENYSRFGCFIYISGQLIPNKFSKQKQVLIFIYFIFC